MNEPPWIGSLWDSFDGLEVIFVGVHCPSGELERRERERHDRKPGMARIQFTQVHAQAIYDAEVDTSTLTPEECAARTVASVASGRRSAALMAMSQEEGS